MSLPNQSWYPSTSDYPPPIIVPTIPQMSSPTSSQYISESSPLITEYPCSHLRTLPEPVAESSSSCATAQVYQSQKQIQTQKQHRHLYLNHYHQQEQQHPQHHTQHPQHHTRHPQHHTQQEPRHSPSESQSHPVMSPKRASQIPHPYARIYAKKSEPGIRRKIWNHTFERSIFTSRELSTLDVRKRRAIYTASLEAHIERLHEKLLSVGIWPVPLEELEQFKGLHCKTAKSMVSGLQHDASICKLKLLAIGRTNEDMQNIISELPQS